MRVIAGTGIYGDLGSDGYRRSVPIGTIGEVKSVTKGGQTFTFSIQWNGEISPTWHSATADIAVSCI